MCLLEHHTLIIYLVIIMIIIILTIYGVWFSHKDIHWTFTISFCFFWAPTNILIQRLSSIPSIMWFIQSLKTPKLFSRCIDTPLLFYA